MIPTYSRVEACGCDDSLTGAFFFNINMSLPYVEIEIE